MSHHARAQTFTMFCPDWRALRITLRPSLTRVVASCRVRFVCISQIHRGKKAAVKAAKASKSKVRAGTHPLLSMVALQLWSRWGWIGTGKPHISPFPRIEVSYADALNHTDDGRLMRTTGRSDCRGAIVVRVATGGPAAIWEAQRINGGKASKVGWSVFC